MDTKAKSSWEPYRPDAAMPWDLARVVHLHRRAGSAGTWREIRRDLADGPEMSVTRVLEGRARLDGVSGDFEPRAASLAHAAAGAGQIERLQAVWLFRMVFSPDPLGERLTLMWHNHFATSNAKVADASLMRRQNDAQRRLARAPFGELLAEMLRDPALLAWLDAPQNVKGSPNENLGRELMELFTLGVGHYTEQDVKDASRTLTGVSVAPDGSVRDHPEQHDDGEKVVLGKRGRWTTDDLRRILLGHPATSRRLAWRICEQFMGEGVVDRPALDELAGVLRDNDLDVGRAVATVLRSRLFFESRNIAARVTSPAEFLVGAVRALELLDPPPSTVTIAEWARRLGQELFLPPNVGGWAGGRAWLSSRAALARANFAAALVAGEVSTRMTPPDLAALPARHGVGGNPSGFFADLLLGGRTPAGLQWNPSDVNASVALMLASPEAQLG